MIDCEPNDVDLEVGGEGGKLHPYVKVREEDSVYMGLPEDAEGKFYDSSNFRFVYRDRQWFTLVPLDWSNRIVSDNFFERDTGTMKSALPNGTVCVCLCGV